MLVCNVMLTGNWAQRSFFITAIARVTAGLRWPVKVELKNLHFNLLTTRDNS